MKYLDEDAEIPITCPECGTAFKRSVGQLAADPKFACPNRSCQVPFDGRELLSALEDSDDALDDFGDNISDMFS